MEYDNEGWKGKIIRWEWRKIRVKQGRVNKERR